MYITLARDAQSGSIERSKLWQLLVTVVLGGVLKGCPALLTLSEDKPGPADTGDVHMETYLDHDKLMYMKASATAVLYNCESVTLY